MNLVYAHQLGLEEEGEEAYRDLSSNFLDQRLMFESLMSVQMQAHRLELTFRPFINRTIVAW